MKAIRNTLFSLTLLTSVSALYCPKTLAMEGDDPQGSVDSSVEKPIKKEDVEDDSKKQIDALEKTKGFIPAVVGFPLLPLNAVDWIADKAPITSTFEWIGGWGLWKERCIGKGLQNYKTGLGRVVVIAAIVSAGYYAWNKYQELKKQNEEDEISNFRVFFDSNEEVDDVTFPTNVQ